MKKVIRKFNVNIAKNLFSTIYFPRKGPKFVVTRQLSLPTIGRYDKDYMASCMLI